MTGVPGIIQKSRKGGYVKEKPPYCPRCKTAIYVVPDRTATRIGTAVGGLLGIGCAKAAGRTTTILLKAVFPQAGIPLHMADTLMTLLLAFAGGAATGAGVGEQIDGKLRMRWRCNDCGAHING